MMSFSGGIKSIVGWHEMRFVYSEGATSAVWRGDFPFFSLTAMRMNFGIDVLSRS